MSQMTFEQWRHELLQLRDADTFPEAKRFVELVDQAGDSRDVQTAAVLFRTLTDKHDHGVKQCIVRALSAYPVETYYRALISDLPRMSREVRSREWTEIMLDYVGRDLQMADLPDIERAYSQSEPENRKVFISLICKEDFYHQFFWPRALIKLLRDKHEL